MLSPAGSSSHEVIPVAQVRGEKMEQENPHLFIFSDYYISETGQELKALGRKPVTRVNIFGVSSSVRHPPPHTHQELNLGRVEATPVTLCCRPRSRNEETEAQGAEGGVGGQ